MNCITVFKIISIIFGSAILISAIYIGLWMFLIQGKDTSSPPEFNEKNAYEENKSTLINSDEKTKLENKNYETKIENTGSKPVSKKNFKVKKIYITIHDEIGDPEIKKAIPKIDTRVSFNDIINNSVTNNNDNENVSRINNSLEETVEATEKNLNIETKNTTEKSHDDILKIKSIKLPINDSIIDEANKNESKFNTNNEETAHDGRNDDVKIKKRIELLNGENITTTETNLLFNNESDPIIIVTPTFVSGENILNKDGNTSIGIKQKLDGNLKNSTNGDGNKLDCPEISSLDTNCSSILYVDDINNNTDGKIQDEDNRKCYGELGCLSKLGTSTWNRLVYPHMNLLPHSRESINTSIIIYTREDPTEGQVIVVSEIKSVELINFNPKRKTIFIIHGYNSSSHEPWVTEMRNELLQHDDFNVLVVDWLVETAIDSFYDPATANARLIGLEIAYLIEHLHTKHGLKLNDVHLIGHSLGAHIAGYAGEKLHGKIGRISGLDPANINFEKMPIHLRLDPTDAKLVDVIHTDYIKIVRLGVYTPCGHLDFYPNGGTGQPGCPKFWFDKSCNHNRAIELFTESINSKCQFIAHECLTYENFIEGKCFLCNSTNSLNCGIMGYHADKSPALLQKLTLNESAINPILNQKFFISTGDKYPYCRRHYRITFKLTKPSKAKLFMEGFINATVYGDNGVINNMQLTPNEQVLKFTHGSTIQIVAVPPENTEYFIGKIRKVELSWVYNKKSIYFLYACFDCNDALYVESIIVDIFELLPQRKKREMDLSSELCSIQGPKQYTAISSGSSAPFIDNCYLSM